MSYSLNSSDHSVHLTLKFPNWNSLNGTLSEILNSYTILDVTVLNLKHFKYTYKEVVRN